MTLPAEYRCVATILFAELSPPADGIGPGHVPDGTHEALAAAAARFGAALSPTLAGSVMAVFGAPTALEDHALRACAAADAMLGAVAAFAGWQVRIGLCSGEVLWNAENHRSGRRAAAVGEAVHAAAKLQQAAAPGTVWLADSTARMVAPWVAARPEAPLTLAPGVLVPAHRLLALRSRALPDAAGADIGGLDRAVPFVGRQRPLQTLEAAAAAVEARRSGQALVVIGEAGIGKTRLLGEFLARHRGIPTLQWPQLSVRPAGAAEPLAQVAADLLGPGALASRAALTRRLDGDPAVKPHLADALADTLFPQRTDPGGRLQQACRALAALAAGRTVAGPLLLVVEDLHWAAPDMLQVVQALAERCAEVPLLVVATGRALPEMPLLRALLQPVRLGPLADADADALLRQAAGGNPDILALQPRLRERCGGNPFFLLRYVEALHQRAAAGARPLSDDRLPATVQSLLAARIDTLAVEERALLRAAAVAGPVIDLAILSAFLGQPADAVRAGLDALSDRGMLSLSRLLPACEYRFQHALIHDAAYAGITRADRRDLHGRLAALLQAWPGDLPGRDEAVARHAQAGRLWDLAFAAGWRAGMDAKRRSRAAAALALLGVAQEALAELEAAGRPPAGEAALDLKLEIARLDMSTAGGKERALALVGEVETAAQAAGDARREALALSIRLTFEWVYVGLREAAGSAERAIAAARRSGDAAVLFEALARASGLFAESGDVAMADAVDGEAQDLVDRVGPACQGDLVLAGPMLIACGRARAASNRGRHAEALRHGRRALDIATALNRQAMDRCYAAAQLGVVAARAGDFGTCRGAMESSLHYGELAETVILRNLALAGRSLAEVMLGRPAAWQDLEAVLARVSAGGHRITELQTRAWAAQARAALGDAAGADRLARDTVAGAGAFGALSIARDAERWLAAALTA